MSWQSYNKRPWPGFINISIRWVSKDHDLWTNVQLGEERKGTDIWIYEVYSSYNVFLTVCTISLLVEYPEKHELPEPQTLRKQSTEFVLKKEIAWLRLFWILTIQGNHQLLNIWRMIIENWIQTSFLFFTHGYILNNLHYHMVSFN